MARSEAMKLMENYKTGENYAYLGLAPHFLIFDEYVAFMEMLTTKENVLSFYDILLQKDFTVDISIPETAIFVQGDKDALQRILFNLISNVIRYGNDGKYLGIFLREDKANIYIDVTDKGKGIKKEFASNVFDRLYTMEDSRNREIQGNGLGLTIAKNLAVQLGGDIFLDSIPNIKTTFTVKLKKISY